MRVLVIVVAAVLVSACGSENPNAPSNFAQLSGNWTGNLQSSNWNAAAVNVQFSQSASSVNGTWVAPAFDWNGTITGTVTSSNFSGTFTLTAPNALGVGPRCTGTASVSGSARTTSNTVNWTSPGFTGSCTGMPLNLQWNLQR